jgi:DNA (cytosine-5)-methyltransferase 1
VIVSLFSGVGGLDLGLEAAGFGPTVVQAESAPFPAAVLAARWPDADQVDDVRKVPALDDVVVLCGGFPCQPVSAAGLKLAQADPRWLWPATADVVDRLRPRYVVAENVEGLRAHALYDVLADFDRLGYCAEWDLIPAAAVGAPHRRERFFVVAWRCELDVGLVFADPPVVCRWWVDNPERLPRLQRGVPDRKHRLTALGNAVVPQVAEHVGRSLAAAIGGTWTPSHAVPLDRWAPRDNGADEHVALDLFGDEHAVAAAVDPLRLPRHGRLDRGQVAELPRSFAVRLNGRRLWPTPPKLPDVPLLPTPAAADSRGSRRVTARTAEWESNTGTTLTDAAWIAEGVDHHAVANRGRGELLLPTPVATDHKGVARPGQRRGQLHGAVLWPTPKASPAGPDYAHVDREKTGGEEPPGRQPPPLNPVWVEWLMGFPADWTVRP